MHLVSDSTGETLRAISKAVIVQYAQVRATEHVHPLVRNERQLSRVVAEIEAMPGIVLYTLVNRDLGRQLEQRCQALTVPCVPVLDPIMKVFEILSWAHRRHRRSAASTCSMPPISGGSML